jgi:glycosyltransferase involved in cell wall biosynthesis
MIVRIVVPCYNSEGFVRETFVKIQDVLSEFNQNCIDVIFVNDGSTDGTGKLLDRLAYKISNVSVLHKSNGGEGSARNFGLEFKGRSYDYAFFVDSDDWMLEEFILAYRYLLNDKPDMLIASYIQSDWNSGAVIKEYNQIRKRYTKLEALEQFMLRNLVPGIGNTFFKKSSIRFTDSSLGSDSYYVFENLLIGNKITGIDQIVYNYRIRSGSAMSSSSVDNILIATNIVEHVGRAHPSLRHAASFFYFNEIIGYYQRTKRFYEVDQSLFSFRWFFKISLRKQIKVILYSLKKCLK